MGSNFYLKLAVANITRDKKMFLPYALCYSIMMAIYFMVISLMTSDSVKGVPAGETLQSMFTFGMVIMTMLIVIFMLYINSFLIKRRKREFGLYGILGLEKRHVNKVIILENLIISIISGVMGVISGCVLGKLIFMLIYYSLKVSPSSKYLLSYKTFLYTGALLIVLFIISSAFNLFQVSLANPIDLLKAENMGEKKVKFIKIKTFVGLALLIWAYYTALSVTNAIAALTLFFGAVIAVIIATYLLFEAGSLLFLNILKSRKNIYYKTNNFISISGMLHRMKQNAAGLASICILSTMVLVTVSTCTALYLGQEDILKEMNPNDITITIQKEPDAKKIREVEEFVKSTALKYGVECSDVYGYSRYKARALVKDESISTLGNSDANSMNEMEKNAEFIKMVDIITQDDYNRMLNKKASLSDNEIILLSSDKELNNKDAISVPGGFLIKEMDSENKLINNKNTVNTSKVCFVVKDNENAKKLYANFVTSEKDIKVQKEAVVIANVSKEGKDMNAFATELTKTGYAIEKVTRIDNIYTNRTEGYGVYGGLLFLGIFFAIQFLCATLLIIYFKQVSEGYDDSSRFVIMQNVGMDEREVKRTINKQILLIFFIPLLGALLHLAFARQMINKLLSAFSLYNTNLTTWCLIITSLVFTLCYIVFYKQTAKVYYKLVKR